MYPPTDQHSADPDPVVREISRIINQFTSIDARSTIVDQSVNQNIWTEGGDVTQIFDQEAVVASGDDAIAAGDDANLIDSDVDVTVGDVSVGNTTNDGSFNTDNSDNSAIDGSFNGTDIDTHRTTPTRDAHRRRRRRSGRIRRALGRRDDRGERRGDCGGCRDRRRRRRRGRRSAEALGRRRRPSSRPTC